MIAHQKVVEGNKNFIIVVLVEDLDLDTLPSELKSYLRTYTYIDARNYEEDLEKIRKKIRYSMPGTPLEKIRQMQRDAAAQQEGEEDTGIEELVVDDEQEWQEEQGTSTADEDSQTGADVHSEGDIELEDYSIHVDDTAKLID